MTPSRPVRLGIFGGTFDPPHVGHLIVARDAADALGLDRVLLVAAAQPPHKDEPAASPALRLEMLRAAAAEDPLLEASGLELSRGGPSYTVDTLRELAARHPGTELVLLIGVDQWRALATWKEPRELGRLATIAVMSRRGEDPAGLDPGVGLACRPVPVTRIDLSSTDVRGRVRQGRSIRHLVPDAVRAIIAREALYRAPSVQHA